MDPIVIALVLGIVIISYCGYVLIDTCCKLMKIGRKKSDRAIRTGMMLPDQHLLETTVDDNYESEDAESIEGLNQIASNQK
jgi:hypothetical protein